MSWLRTLEPRPDAPLRLVCLPHAGGTASFFTSWFNRMPPEVELSVVQYPGRETRLREPTYDDLHRFADDLAAALVTPRPLALFGHSMGAVVAYEVARRLPRPVALVVSARQPPHRARVTRKHLVDDETLWADVRRLGGMHDFVFMQPDIRALALPILRADLQMIETYQPRELVALDCPIFGFAAAADTTVTVAEMQAWAELTRDRFDLEVFPGDHFYLLRERPQVIERVLRCLGSPPR